MKRRKIDPEVKMAAVLEALRGESTIAEICRKYQISETLFYRWRDRFLEAGKKGLADRNGSGVEASVKARIFAEKYYLEVLSAFSPPPSPPITPPKNPRKWPSHLGHELSGL